MLLYIELMGAPSTNNNNIIREMGHHPILLSPDHRKLLLGFARLDMTRLSVQSVLPVFAPPLLVFLLYCVDQHTVILCVVPSQSSLSLRSGLAGWLVGWLAWLLVELWWQ